MRLDIFLASRYKKFSRGFLQKFIREIGVKVNGKLIKKTHYALGGDDKVELSADDLEKFSESKIAVPRTRDIKKETIIYENKDFLVIDKEPFICSEDVINGFFPVHRLDKDTSGVLVIAKNIVAQAALQKQWRNRIVKKTYITLVKGILKPEKGAIDAGIFRSMKDRRRMAVSDSSGSRSSFTEYKVKKYFTGGERDCSLIYVYPKTGRTHQIRVHFAAIGYPVIGDNVYGDKSLNQGFKRQFGLKRQFLHACELKIMDLETGKKQTFKSHLPKDLESVLRVLSS